MAPRFCAAGLRAWAAPGIGSCMRFSFEAVIFDLDGTLIDSADLWYRAACQAVRRYYDAIGVEGPLPSRARTDSLIGEPPGPLIARLVPPEHAHRLDLVTRTDIESRQREMQGSSAARGGDGMRHLVASREQPLKLGDLGALCEPSAHQRLAHCLPLFFTRAGCGDLNLVGRGCGTVGSSFHRSRHLSIE